MPLHEETIKQLLGKLQQKIDSQQETINTLADALGQVLDWIDGESPDFNPDGVEDQDAWNERSGQVWWDAFDVLKKARG